MPFHRVTWVDPGWQHLTPDNPGHPSYIPIALQRRGRFDNNAHYAALYLASSAMAAVGETFANSHTWLAEEITRPSRDGAPRSLVTYESDESTQFYDFDNAESLLELGMNPSQIISRDRTRTQAVALDLWHRRTELGIAGLQWWSYIRPEWTITMAWSQLSPRGFAVTPTVVETLTPDHPAVVAASEELMRRIEE